MSATNRQKLEEELMVSGTQLLHDIGVPTHLKLTSSTISRWARTHAEIISRRLRL